MPKKFIKRLVPDHKKIKEHKHMRIFGKLLHDANLWHLNRRSAAGAFGVGLFYAFIPVPFQMLLAAATAIPLRVNLPLSVGLVWITNPLTMPAIFYGCYLVGASLLGQEQQAFEFEASWAWLESSLSTIGPSFLFGCLVCATIGGIVGYATIRLLWRWSIINAWKERKNKRPIS